MTDLFPEIEPYHSERLPVDELHTLYIEQAGNPRGIPVLFLHGGPGAGCEPYHRRFFDPKRYREVVSMILLLGRRASSLPLRVV